MKICRRIFWLQIVFIVVKSTFEFVRKTNELSSATYTNDIFTKNLDVEQQISAKNRRSADNQFDNTPTVEGKHHHNHHDWGYDEHNGPHKWGKQCQHGTRQSPIDIRTSNVEFAIINELHFVNYDVFDAVEIKNNGHTVVVSGFDKWSNRQRPYIYGGGLSGKYLLAQFHFHWAAEHDDGSEHTVNALHYPIELHLVHVKDGLTMKEAIEEANGLAVVGIFYHVGEDGTSMANLESGLKRVVEKDSATLIFNYTMSVHLPENVENFYRYSGSLTTPGCNEAVIWTVMAEPLPILMQQLELFRAVQGHTIGTPLSDNVRPVQALNGRRVQFRSSAFNRHRLCNISSSSWSAAVHGMAPRGHGTTLHTCLLHTTLAITGAVVAINFMAINIMEKLSL